MPTRRARSSPRTRGSRPNRSSGIHPAPRVFVSYSRKDKRFVDRLVGDIEAKELPVWLDERALDVGDSIVEGISSGLTDSDYIVVVLSRASVESRWVRAELSAALMRELSGQGTLVLPVLKEDCDVPPLLADRVYADFRRDYEAGLKGLLSVLEQEAKPASLGMTDVAYHAPADWRTCVSVLSALKVADLRRRMCSRMSRTEVATIWFDVFESKMEDDLAGRALVE